MSMVPNQSEGPQGSGISFCTRKRDVWSWRTTRRAGTGGNVGRRRGGGGSEGVERTLRNLPWQVAEGKGFKYKVTYCFCNLF